MYYEEYFQTQAEEQQTESRPSIISNQNNCEEGNCLKENLKEKLSQYVYLKFIYTTIILGSLKKLKIILLMIKTITKILKPKKK